MANIEGRLVSFVVYFLLCSIGLIQSNGALMCCAPNVALKKPTYQGPDTLLMSDFNRYKSGKAVDGIETDNHGWCTHTVSAQVTWWVVDLLAVYKIHSLAVLNRDTYGYRLQNFTVDIFMTDPRKLPGFPEISGKICTYHESAVPRSEWAGLKCISSSSIRRFVRVIKRGFDHLTLCEVRMKRK